MVRIIKHTLPLTVIFYTVCLTSANHPNGKWIQNKGLWYFISDGQALNYTQAAAFCSSMDSYLAVITNTEQNSYLKNVTADNKYWIGYSSNKKNHDLGECQDLDLFWNDDRNCVLRFAPDKFNVANASRSGCTGVYFKSSAWTERPCNEKYEFICQWTCRRLFLPLTGYDTKNISGYYIHGGYYNEHVVYNHENKEYAILYSNSKSNWYIKSRIEYKYEYYANNSDVPYRANDLWYIAKTRDISPSLRVGATCIDCDKFRMRTSWDDTDVVVHLIECSVGKPFYSDKDSVYTISPGQLNGSNYWYVNINGTHTGTFGDIFPYPRRVTIIQLDNKKTIRFTQACDENNQPPSNDTKHINTDEKEKNTNVTDNNDRDDDIDDDGKLVNICKLIHKPSTVGPLLPAIETTTEISTAIARNISLPNDDRRGNGAQLKVIIVPIVGGAVFVIIVVILIVIVIVRRKRKQTRSSNVEQLEYDTCEITDSPKSESDKGIANEPNDLYDDYYEIEEQCDKPTSEIIIAKDQTNNSSLRDVQRDVNQNPYTLVNGNNQSGKDNINSTDIPMAKLSLVPMRSDEPASDDHRKSQYEETGDILRELEKPDKQQFIPNEKTTFPIDHVYAKVLKPSSINSDKSTDKRKSNPLLSAEMQKQFSESIPNEDSDDLQLHENEIYGTEDFNMSQREMITSTPLRPAAQFVEDNVYEDPEECRTETKEPKCKAESKDTKPPPDQLYSAVQKPLSSIKGNKHQNPLYPKELLQTFTNTQTAADDADELQLHENEIYGTGD